MNNILAFNAVIFDMDGLLLDTESTYIHAWRQALDHMNYDLHTAFEAEVCGLAYPAIAELLMQHYGSDFDLAGFAALSNDFWLQQAKLDGIAVKPGAPEVLQWLNAREVPYCLATNSPQAKAITCLEFAGLQDSFAVVLGREHVTQPKPYPDIFLKAAEILQCNINTCLVLEDSYPGILAASRAGAQAIYIPSLPRNLAAASLAHAEYPDLLQFLENLSTQYP